MSKKDSEAKAVADIWIQETYVNAGDDDEDRQYMIGETDWYESCYTTATKPGEIFADLQREYGRCTGKMYKETRLGDLHVGWVFQQRRKYEDSAETYLHETWVELAPRYLPDEDEPEPEPEPEPTKDRSDAMTTYTAAMIVEGAYDASADDFLEACALLARTGAAWVLQGCIGRTVASMIESGRISPTGEILDVDED